MAKEVQFMEEGHLRRDLGLGSLVALVVGSIIGSGIFFLPGAMLASFGSEAPDGSIAPAGGAGLVMAAWAVGALVALCGGLMFAELGGAFPKTGGQYRFIRDALGKRPAFLFSWTAFAIVQTGTIAAVAVAFANSVDRIIPAGYLPDTHGAGLPGTPIDLGFAVVPRYGVAFLAIAAMALLTYVNYRGVRRGAWVSNVSTVAKLAALAFVAVAAFGFAPDAGSFDGGLAFSGFTLAGFATAVAISLFAYDGFAQATFVAGEVKDAGRVLPRAIVIATLIVAAVYLVAAYAFFHAVHPGDVSSQVLAGDHSIAMDAAGAALGGWAVALVAVAIAVSTFGTVNAYVLASPRIYHAVAKAREFPRPFGHLSMHGTPTYGLVYGLLWAGFLTLTGSFESLANLVVFGLYAFYLVTVAAYFVLRRRHPEAFLSFGMRLAPVPAAIFGLATLGVLASFLYTDIARLAGGGSVAGFLGGTTMSGIILILVGLALFAWQERSARRKDALAKGGQA